MNDKAKQIKEEPTEKMFTAREVEQMISKNRDEIRQEAIKAMSERQVEIKGDLLQAGSDNFYNIAKWEVMKTMANDMAKSGAIPESDNAFTLMMKMQAGREMGLKPIESIKSFYVVKGILNIYGDAVIRRLREHGWTLLPYKEDALSCTATIRKGEEEYSETFTFEEAEKSGWTKSNTGILKVGWKEGINRRRKLRYGVISTLIKTYVPEVLGSAVDIAEVAEDTIPLYSKTNGSNVTTLTEEKQNEPATPAQRNLLKIPDDQELTFGEAVTMIKDLTKKGDK